MIHIENLDLNLLRVFHAVYKTRNITRASERLYLSQSAVSHAMNRLRHVLKDDLFVKAPGGVKPTPRSVQLAPQILQALNILEAAINPKEFTPLDSTHIFRVATHDYFVYVALNAISQSLMANAPNTSLRIRHTEGKSDELLDEQSVDLVITAFGQIPERFSHQQILQDDYVCVTNQMHAFRTDPSLEHYLAQQHLLVSPKGDERGFIDDLLAKKGKSRHVALIVNHFSACGELLENSNLVAVLPRLVAQKLCRHYSLVILPCPLTAPTDYSQTKMVWHSQLGQHQALDWFRTLVSDVCRDISK